MPPQPIEFQSPREERIHRRLGLVGEGPQAFYRDALRLIRGPILESVTHVVGHLLREIESALRDALEPITQYMQDNSGGKSAKAHEREVRTILRELGLNDAEGAGAAWVAIASTGLAEHAHRRALERPRSLDDDFRELWDDVEGIFDVVLEGFESRFLDLHDAIDRMICKPAPSTEDLKYIQGYLPNNPTTRFYLFGRLEQPGWLKPLNEAGFFSNPPAPIRDEASGTTTFPQWPVLRYLERMAAVGEQPDLVVQILLNIPATDNPFTHDELAAVLSKLPSASARLAIDRVSTWMPSSAFTLLAEKLGSVATRLALDGYVNDGFALLRIVLDPRRLARSNARQSHEGYEYGQVLKKEVPTFTNHWPNQTLSFLCNLLEQATRSDDDADAVLESYHWRRTIAAARSWRRYEILDLLVDAVRDTAVGFVKKDGANLGHVLRELAEHTNEIFRRIELHVLSAFPLLDIGYVQHRLLDRAAFDQWYEAQEYVRLLSTSFEHISDGARNQIIEWIEAGPDLADPDPDSPFDAERVIGNWQHARLKALRGKLPDRWQQRLDVLEDGRTTRAEDDEDDGVQWGPTSPRSTDDLKAMPVDELVTLLRTWRPPPGWHHSSPEGLGRVLSSVVAENPAPIASRAGDFKTLDPTYVRALLQGLVEALKAGHTFPWHPVLDLCRWIVDRPYENESSRRDWGRDPGWGWSRNNVASVIAAAVDAAVNPIPFDHRDQLWQVLEPLTWDPDPAPERDANRPLSDALQQAINSVRGTAVGTVIRYGVWVEKHFREFPGAETGMASMPEVQQNLDDHLDRSRESSPAIRAVFGESFPVLWWIDHTWAAARVDAIFSKNDRELFEAAWTTYVRFRPAYNDLFPVLGDLYEQAVNELAPESRQHVDHDAYDQHLAMHLMTYLGAGVPRAMELARAFFSKADLALRRSALDYIGRNLHSARSRLVAAGTLERIRDLWESRIEAAIKAGEPKELEPFGWCVVSGKFDAEWVTTRALRILNAGSSLEPDHLVVEFLDTFAASEPMTSVNILESILDNVRDHWTVHGWKDEARNVLCVALSSDDNATIARARVVINKFAARGFIEFRDLLNTSNGTGADQVDDDKRP